MITDPYLLLFLAAIVAGLAFLMEQFGIEQ
jgi:hypothetical protein